MSRPYAGEWAFSQSLTASLTAQKNCLTKLINSSAVTKPSAQYSHALSLFTANQSTLSAAMMTPTAMARKAPSLMVRRNSIARNSARSNSSLLRTSRKSPFVAKSSNLSAVKRLEDLRGYASNDQANHPFDDGDFLFESENIVAQGPFSPRQITLGGQRLGRQRFGGLAGLVFRHASGAKRLKHLGNHRRHGTPPLLMRGLWEQNEDKSSRLTSFADSGNNSPVAGNKQRSGVRTRMERRSAASNTQCGYFFALVRPSMAGRAGQLQSWPMLHRYSHPRSVCHHSVRRVAAVQNRNWSNTMAPIAQGAAAPISAQADTPQATAELIVVIRPYDLDHSIYRGTRAQIEAEGVIPADTQWPDGYDNLHWVSGSFDFSLRRQRPEGMKGTRKQFIDFDWWCLRWELSNQPSPGEKQIARKKKELADAICRQSREFDIEFMAKAKRYYETAKDTRFQAFKASIPGLTPPKRGRKSNSTHNQGA